MAHKIKYLEQYLIRYKTQRFGTKQIREMLVKTEVSLGLLEDLRVDTAQQNTVREHFDEEILMETETEEGNFETEEEMEDGNSEDEIRMDEEEINNADGNRKGISDINTSEGESNSSDSDIFAEYEKKDREDRTEREL